MYLRVVPRIVYTCVYSYPVPGSYVCTSPTQCHDRRFVFIRNAQDRMSVCRAMPGPYPARLCVRARRCQCVCLFLSRVPITLLRSDFGKEFERIVDRQQDRRCKNFKLRSSLQQILLLQSTGEHKIREEEEEVEEVEEEAVVVKYFSGVCQEQGGRKYAAEGGGGKKKKRKKKKYATITTSHNLFFYCCCTLILTLLFPPSFVFLHHHGMLQLERI